jgi:hypothetical protein
MAISPGQIHALKFKNRSRTVSHERDVLSGILGYTPCGVRDGKADSRLPGSGQPLSQRAFYVVIWPVWDIINRFLIQGLVTILILSMRGIGYQKIAG